MERELLRGTKLVYRERCYVLPLIPDSLGTLQKAVAQMVNVSLAKVLCYGVSVRGEFVLNNEMDFQEFARVCPELNCFELEDLSPRVSLPLRLTSLVGMKCLHQHSFKLQSFSLESYNIQSTAVKLSAGFSYVFFDNGLFITGGTGEQVRAAVFFRDEVLTPHPDLLSEHCSHLSLTNGQLIYVFGGMDTRMKFSRDCEVYSYTSSTWMSLPKLSRAVQFPTGCLANDTCFLLTGQELEVLRADAWETLPFHMPDGFRAATLTQIRADTLLVFGGLGSDKTAELNLQTLTMETVANVPAKSKFFMNPVKKYRGSVYVWGPNLESIYAYRINLQLWAKVNLDLWQGRVGLLLAYHRGRTGDAMTSVWKLPLSLLRDTCVRYL